MKKLLLSMIAVLLGLTTYAAPKETVLWEGEQDLSWNAAPTIPASACADFEEGGEIRVYYTVPASYDYLSLGVLFEWGAGKDPSWGGANSVVATAAYKSFLLDKGTGTNADDAERVKAKGFFLVGNKLTVTKITYVESSGPIDPTVLQRDEVIISDAQASLDFAYDDIVKAGGKVGGGIAVEYSILNPMGYNITFKHQGVAAGVEQPDGKTYTDEEAPYVWADFTNPQTIDEDGRMILYLSEATMNELNSYSKRLIVQAGYIKVTKVKVLTAAELPDVPELSIVAFDKETLTFVEVGQSEKITATIKPAADAASAKWSSSDPNVATVDNQGNVTAVGGGKAVITCETANAKATCEVSVIAIIGQWRENQSGQWIYGDATDITCKIGEAPRLYITTIPEDASVTFSATQDPETCASYYAYASSKNAEVSFSKGKTGKVEITVKLNGYDLTKTFSVTAIDYPELCLKLNTSVHGNPDYRNILAGADFEIDASVRWPGYNPYGDEEPDKPFYKQAYTWTVSDPTIAEVKSQEDANSNYGAYSNAIIVGKKSGTVTVTASVTSADGTQTITGTTQELTFTGHGEKRHQFYFQNDRGGSWTSKYNVGSINGNGVINDIVLHGEGVDMNLESATTVSYIPKFTAGQVFSFKVNDPNNRILSISASPASSATALVTFGDKTTCSVGTNAQTSWSAPDEDGVQEVTFTVLDDKEVSGLIYWNVVMYHYATPELALNETEISGTAGSTKQLSVEVTNKDTEKVLNGVTVWSSADPAIASVDQTGNVTLVSNGETEITADYNGTKAVCKVTVAGQSGIDAIGSDADNAPAEYFNLQGMRVDASNLTPGIYIVRKGNETQKVIIK